MSNSIAIQRDDVAPRSVPVRTTSAMAPIRFLSLCVLLAVAVTPCIAAAHCQVPCGIYDDHARVQSMLEGAATVAKASHEIAGLVGKTDAQSINQQVRWVNTKEQHAQKVIDTIANYFLTQRVKSDAKDYATRLAKHHAVIVAAMQAKQSADPAEATALKTAIEQLVGYYPKHPH